MLPVGEYYFFFVAFFAAFFAGAFLVAFFVAICLFSLFDGLHRSCNINIAVEECIDSCFNSVKKKTNDRWKKWQQFFDVEFDVTRKTQMRWCILSSASINPAMQSCHACAMMPARRLRRNSASKLKSTPKTVSITMLRTPW